MKWSKIKEKKFDLTCIDNKRSEAKPSLVMICEDRTELCLNIAPIVVVPQNYNNLNIKLKNYTVHSNLGLRNSTLTTVPLFLQARRSVDFGEWLVKGWIIYASQATVIKIVSSGNHKIDLQLLSNNSHLKKEKLKFILVSRVIIELSKMKHLTGVY